MGLPEIVAEVANLHEGSLGVAKSFVAILKETGVRTVKFQMHLAEEEGTRDEPFRVKFSDQDLSRQDYWRRVSFSTENWINLKQYCDSQEIEFLCTPFSLKAAKFLHENSLVKRWKVASGQATDWELIDFMALSKLPLIISTGLISDSELKILKNRLQKNAAWERTTLLHCVSKYPADLSSLNLDLIDELKKLGAPIGYSDHSGSIYPSLYSMLKGAQIVEVHFTPHKKYFGPDVTSSLTADEIGLLVEASRIFEILKSTTTSREQYLSSVTETSRLFRKGIYWSGNFERGHIVRKDSFLFLKPVSHLDAVDFELFIGKKLKKSVIGSSPVLLNDFE